MKKLLQILNIIGFGAMVYVNYLANAQPINGRTTGELSDEFPNLFTPAGITFSIWGVIYLLLLGFVIYQAKDLFKSTPDNTPWFSKIGVLFFLTCIANISWIYAWHYGRIPESVGIMTTFLILLILIYNNLGKVRYAMSKTERWLVALPFSVYLGWITVAMIANVTTLLVDINWDGFGLMLSNSSWAIIMIVIATFIAQTVTSKRGDIAYGLVIIWAFAGIILKQKDAETNIAIAAGIGILLLSLILIPQIWRSLRS